MFQRDERIDFLRTLIEKGFDYKYIQSRFLEQFNEVLSIDNIYEVYRQIALEHYIQDTETGTKNAPLFPELRFTLRYIPPSKILTEIVDGENTKWKILSATDHSGEEHYLLVKHRDEFVDMIPLSEPPVAFLLKNDVLVIAFKHSIVSIYLRSLKETFRSSRLGFEIKSITEGVIEYERDIIQEFKLYEDGNFQFQGIIRREGESKTDDTGAEGEDKSAKDVAVESLISAKETEVKRNEAETSNQQSDVSTPFLLTSVVISGETTQICVTCYFKSENPRVGLKEKKLIKAFPYEFKKVVEQVKGIKSSYKHLKIFEDIEIFMMHLERFMNDYVLSTNELIILGNDVYSMFLLGYVPHYIVHTEQLISFKVESGELKDVEKKEITWNPWEIPSIKRDKFYSPSPENRMWMTKRNVFLSTSNELVFFGTGESFTFVKTKERTKHTFFTDLAYQSTFEVEPDRLYAVLCLNSNKLTIYGLEISDIPKLKELITKEASSEGEFLIGDLYVCDTAFFRTLFDSQKQYLVPNLYETVLSYRVAEEIVFFFTDSENIVCFTIEGDFLGKICESQATYDFRTLPENLEGKVYFIDRHIIAILDKVKRVSGSKGFERHVNVCLGGEIETLYREKLLEKYQVPFRDFIKFYLEGEEK